MKYSSIVLILASAISMVSCTSSQQEVVPKEEPYWKFKDCILARFNMSITIQPDVKNPNKTAIVSIPSDAKVDTDKSSCGDINATDPTKTDQLLVLTWKDGENGYDREISINFRRNLTSHFYGVERFYGIFFWEKWTGNGTNGTTVDFNKTMHVDSNEMSNIIFHTPLDRSFTCANWGSTKLKTYYQVKPTPPAPTNLPDATVHSDDLQFDAFRNADSSTPAGFRVSLDCEFQPNDIVPIAVGIALALLVVVVLIAYVIGRRRNRQRGYESV